MIKYTAHVYRKYYQGKSKVKYSKSPLNAHTKSACKQPQQGPLITLGGTSDEKILQFVWLRLT